MLCEIFHMLYFFIINKTSTLIHIQIAPNDVMLREWFPVSVEISAVGLLSRPTEPKPPLVRPQVQIGVCGGPTHSVQTLVLAFGLL